MNKIIIKQKKKQNKKIQEIKIEFYAFIYLHFQTKNYLKKLINEFLESSFIKK